MMKMAAMVKRHNYRGYVSFESLSDGNPKTIIKNMLAEFKKEYNKN